MTRIPVGSINDLAISHSLFSVTHEINTFLNELNNYLPKINDWDLKWKINSNHDPSKQTPEFAFSEKSKKKNSSAIIFQ